jgi:hypothetical protein
MTQPTTLPRAPYLLLLLNVHWLLAQAYTNSKHRHEYSAIITLTV